VLIGFDLRTRTTLVCGALALAIAASVLLRGRTRPLHLVFAAFAADMGLWYLAQSFYGFFQASIWERFAALLAVLLPQLALTLFDSMVPSEHGRRSRLIRASWLLAVPMVVLVLMPHRDFSWVRTVIFFYVFFLITAGLFLLGQRGKNSPSRATQRRVQFLVVIGAAAGLATIADFVWFLGARTPPIGAAISIVFLFVLAQALRYQRLLDLYEMVARLLVATALAFLIAGIFYVLLTFIGGFNTMYVNAVLAAIVILVLFEPLQARVEEQMQKLFFRERADLDEAVAVLRRRLVHTLEIEDMGRLVMSALEESRRVTAAAFYLRDQDGTGFDRVAHVGPTGPLRIEVATARALLDRLEQGSVSLEAVETEARERRARGERADAQEAVLTSSAVLGSLRQGVLISVRAEGGDPVGLLAIADERVRDFISPEEISLLEQVAAQMGVVIENSRLYAQMKERDRLAILGQMAAGLAHEIRNPLGAIKGAAQLLSEPLEEDDKLDASSREFLGIILEEVERLNRVVGSVLDLARPNQTAMVRPTDLNAAVRRTVQVLSAEPENQDLEIGLVLDPELPRVAIDPELFRQVLMNLVRNAAHAMKGKGRVTITSRARFGRGTRPGAGEPKSSDEPFAEITVADTGPGISQKMLENIFLPFFTTKDQGTGLGLAISQRIVQGAGGRIEVKSYEGKGSSFSVVLPAAAEVLTGMTPAPGESAAPPASDSAESVVLHQPLDGPVGQ
jgi:two-component system, NtrC family, sensor histidine kinase HydH